MSDFTVIEIATKSVKRTGVCPEHCVAIQAMDGEFVFVGKFPEEDFHFLDGRPTAREPLHVKIDGLTLSNLPPDTVVVCGGIEYPPITDGIAEFDFNLPGDYVIDIKPPRHQHGRVTLTK